MLIPVDSGGETGLIEQRRVVLPVAPATQDGSNTIRPPLRPLGGLRLDDLRFLYGGSYLVADAAVELSLLRQLLDAHPGSRIALFGHDDRSSGVEGGWTIAGRRALSVLAVLLDRADLWRSLWSNPVGEDDWKQESIVLSMMDALSVADPTYGPPSRASDASPDVWFEALARDYFRLLRTCPSTGEVLPILGEDRLLVSKAPSWKGNVQSCSDFNPLRLLAEGAHGEKLAHFARYHETSHNRRVMVYVFPAWMQIEASSWPCPTVDGERSTCRTRLFVDEADRLRPAEDRMRRHAQGDPTFRCRFYERMVRGSAIEREGDLRRVGHISVELRSNSGSVPLARRPFQLHLEDGSKLAGVTDERGGVRLAHVRAGSYRLDIDEHHVFVTTLPPEVPVQVVRVPGYTLVVPS